VRQYLFDGTIRTWQIVIPDFGTITGPFQITHLEYSGRHDGEITFELTLDSAGELTFAAAL
jgi:TP901-1 family phage major tail protein